MGDVLIARTGGLGRITLNRPKAINALTLDMVREIDAALIEFEGDPAVRAVLIDGTGERGLCAGGDIRALAEGARSGNGFPAMFFAEEYRMNRRIARFSKPVVVVQDGLVMGGGIGISGHASHRIVTERAVLGMPEVGIGFIPDVGGTYLLGSAAPGELGTHVALACARLGAADAMLCGLSDYAIESGRIGSLADLLADAPDGAAIDTTLRGLAFTPAAGAVAAGRAWIDRCYAADNVEEIVSRLRASPEPAAAEAVLEIETKCPTSLKVTLRALRAARADGRLEPCLDREFHLAVACMDEEFPEGVRAAVIDKDRNPKWSPASLEDVTPARVDRFFGGTLSGQSLFA